MLIAPTVARQQEYAELPEKTDRSSTAPPMVTYTYNETNGAAEKLSTTVEGKTKTVTGVYHTRGDYRDASEDRRKLAVEVGELSQ